jgi:hypothetical protein
MSALPDLKVSVTLIAVVVEQLILTQLVVKRVMKYEPGM